MTFILASVHQKQICMTADHRANSGTTIMDVGGKIVDCGRYAIGVSGHVAQVQMIEDTMHAYAEDLPEYIDSGTHGIRDVRRILQKIRAYGAESGLLACAPQDDGSMMLSSGLNLLIATERGSVYQCYGYNEVLPILGHVWAIGSGALLGYGFYCGLVEEENPMVSTNPTAIQRHEQTHEFVARRDSACSASYDSWVKTISHGA